jgi:hypothetical protein
MRFTLRRATRVVTLLLVCSSLGIEVSGQTRDVQTPIRSFAVNVPIQATPTFLDQFESFAKTNGFRFAKAIVRPDGAHYSVQLQRSDIRIVAVNSFDVERFNVGLYASEESPNAKERAQTLIDALSREFNGTHGITFLSREAPEDYVKTLGVQGLDGHAAIQKMGPLGFECELKSEIPSGLNPKGEVTSTGKRVVPVPRHRIECTKRKPEIGENCPQLRVALFLDHAKFDPIRQREAPLEGSRVWRVHGECQVPKA